MERAGKGGAEVSCARAGSGGVRKKRRELIRVIGVRDRPTARQLRAIGPFGLAVSRNKSATRHGDRDGAREELVRGLGDACVVILTGPSGSGKSTALRGLGRGLRKAGERVEFVHGWRCAKGLERRAVIDAMPGRVSEAVRWLAAAGLAEATLYVRRVGELSDGQRQRFVVARGLALAWRRGGWVCVDEFAAGLDGLAGWALTRTLAREVGRGRGRLRVALATSDERVLRWVVSACGERGVGVVVREMVRGAGVECGGERGLLAA